MKKFTVLAGLMALALVIGVAGSTFRADKAEARPTDVISFNPDVCIFLTVGGDADLDADGTDEEITFADAIGVCYGLATPANLAILADALEGDVDDPGTYAPLVDATAAQLGSHSLALAPDGQDLWVLTFVTNDDALHLDADEGIWLSSGVSQTDCPFDDADCDADTLTAGDGVVPDVLFAGGAAPLDLGDAIVTATQSGVDVEMDYTVVGPPDDLSLTATKTTIQEFSGAACSLGDVADEVGLPDVSLLIAKIVDDDGTELTGIWTGWLSSEADAVDLATDRSVSIVSDAGTAALNLGCGDEVGASTVTAGVLDGFAFAPSFDAEDIEDIDAEIDITVVGAPASMTLAANPPSITCNGTNTSEVSATLLDADGKPVVAGNAVRFEVVALGIANPIIAKTDANGVAKSTITPLSGVTAGVTVLVMVVADETIVQNILVACQPAVPTVVPPPFPPTPPVVTPPVTGDGGYLP